MERRVLALGRIDSELKTFESRYAAAFHEYGQKEIALLARQIADGLNVKVLLGPSAPEVFRFRKQLKAKLLGVLEQVKEFGTTQVREELQRQG